MMLLSVCKRIETEEWGEIDGLKWLAAMHGAAPASQKKRAAPRVLIVESVVRE